MPPYSSFVVLSQKAAKWLKRTQNGCIDEVSVSLFHLNQRQIFFELYKSILSN